MGEAGVIWSRLTSAFLMNCQLFGLTLLFALPLGLLVSLGSMSRFTPLRGVVKTFVWIIRGTPLMLQIIVIYLGPGLMGFASPWGSSTNGRLLAAVVAFVITSPLPLWTSITDGGWGYLVSGVLLYLLRNHRKAQVAVWALNSFLWDFVLVYLQLRGQPGFELSQMFTTYYEWFGVAAAVLMLAYNGMRGSGHKQLFYWFYPAHVYLLYGVSCLVYRLIA